jgi:hypothetical protein
MLHLLRLSRGPSAPMPPLLRLCSFGFPFPSLTGSFSRASVFACERAHIHVCARAECVHVRARAREGGRVYARVSVKEMR